MPLPSKGVRSAERIRRACNVDLLVAWALIAWHPFRCWLIRCCYMTGILTVQVLSGGVDVKGMERRYARPGDAARATAAPALRRGARSRSAALAHSAG